jgi:lipoyl(octanoyl) transferase
LSPEVASLPFESRLGTESFDFLDQRPMTRRCRILPHQAADGPANMALDEALLDAVAEHRDAAYLRTYGWTIPTLSLGYFQRLAEVQGDPRWRSVPVVRRLTGGGAIWHHHELTYALILPAAHPLVRPHTAVYRAVHAAIARTLAEVGVVVDRRAVAVPHGMDGRSRPFLCFIDRDPEDLVYRGFKLVGSAQRRRRGAILQQGSILLAGSPLIPEVRGCRDLAEVPRSCHEWAERLRESIPPALGLEPEAIAVPNAIRARASELESAIYRTVGWTGAR